MGISVGVNPMLLLVCFYQVARDPGVNNLWLVWFCAYFCAFAERTSGQLYDEPGYLLA